MPGVIVFGYDELLLATLEVLQEAGAPVAAVVFPATRAGDNVQQVRRLVADQGHALLTQPRRPGAAPFVDQLRRLAPELVVAWSYPMLLPPEVLAVPPLGCVNLHMGLLPQYRGASAFRWAIARGDTETGVTLHYMAEAADAGPVIARDVFPLDREDDVVAVLKKSRTAGMRVLRACWPAIAQGTAPRLPQDESLAGYYPPFRDADARIDWTQSSVAVYNLVRSLTPPFPGAWTTLHGKRLVIRNVLPVEAGSQGKAPGTVLARHPEGPLVATGAGAVVARSAAYAGEAGPIPIAPGDRFGV